MNSIKVVIVSSISGSRTLQPSMSGAERISAEFARTSSNSFSKTYVATSHAGIISHNRYFHNYKIHVENSRLEYIITDDIYNKKPKYWDRFVFTIFSTLSTTVKLLSKRLNIEIIYSASDYPSDLLPSLLLKFLNPNAKLLVGFYLMAPNPTLPYPSNPYTGKYKFSGILFYVWQKIAIAIAKQYISMAWVTNEKDGKLISSRLGLSDEFVLNIKGGIRVVDISENGDNLNNFNYDCVFVGRLERMKGVLELIEIWRLVVNQMPRARLEIIGNGLLEDEIRSKIILCELLPNIDLLGFLGGEEKEAVLRKSKVFLHPSIYDSGGMAAAEAMGFGLPVVGFELANDYYVRGIVRVPLLNLNEFARAIIKLLTDSTYYSKMSQEAKEYSKEWSWDFRGDLMISAVCKLFQENVM